MQSYGAGKVIMAGLQAILTIANLRWVYAGVSAAWGTAFLVLFAMGVSMPLVRCVAALTMMIISING
jgi:hypothetical protein